MNDRLQQIMALVKAKGVLRPRDLDSFSIPREYLRRLYERGSLQRVGRGLYVLPDAEATEYQTLTERQNRKAAGS